MSEAFLSTSLQGISELQILYSGKTTGTGKTISYTVSDTAGVYLVIFCAGANWLHMGLLINGVFTLSMGDAACLYYTSNTGVITGYTSSTSSTYSLTVCQLL